MASRRALHFVFKVGDRTATAKFYEEILGMKVLRHEEFEEGCKATCNGPYDGKWSKTMVGYGAEDSHFVVELTYNYGIGTYKLGNDFLGMTINSPAAIQAVKKHGWPSVETQDGGLQVADPGGYKFYLQDKPANGPDPVACVTLAVSDLKRSTDYWANLLSMKLLSESDDHILLSFGTGQCELKLQSTGGKPVEHESAFGRIAFSCPAEQLAGIEKAVKEKGGKIITPLISLDTPGKATVQVVILADPNDHEICFVGDEAFRQLSLVDPKGENLLKEGIAADKSAEWFAKKGKEKATA